MSLNAIWIMFEALRQRLRDERGQAAQVVMIAGMVLLALAVVGIITAKVLTTANKIQTP